MRRKRLLSMGRATFTLLFLLLTAQTTLAALEGSGTEGSPYLIKTDTDWNEFASSITSATSYSGEYVKLDASISVTTMAVTSDDTRFCGTFDGGGKTITFNIDKSSEDAVALFRSIQSATIKNLNVAGSVTGKRHVAALVGTSFGSGNVINNCKVSADVTCTEKYMGGIFGHGKSSGITISSCVFSGLLSGGAVEHMGVFYGWSDAAGEGCERSIVDCLYVMKSGQSTSILDLVDKSGSTATFPVNSCL